jgi:beta-ureidopropionase / N-carbamoyl-L-amino-acid hydrolase
MEDHGVIDIRKLASRLAGLRNIGRGPRGWTRLAWTPEDAEAAVWFVAQARSIGHEPLRDPAGNLWACPPSPGPWWAVGSHLDTVRDGGEWDGALGVAAAFEVARGSDRPVAVISFADEEGARFNTPTFGSRALVGRLDVDDVLARRDDEGVTLADAMARAGVDPAGLTRTPEWLDRLRGFLELHIDQSRDVANAGAPVGVVRALAARLRLEITLLGAADHAGTTPRRERRDALLSAARLIVAADDLAEVLGVVATAARIVVDPNAPTTVPARARLWLDARAASADAIEGWRAGLEEAARNLEGVAIEIREASRSGGTVFPDDVRDALRTAATPDAPEIVCFAGHDAGVLAGRVEAGMVLVRNARGVSHSPDEQVELADGAAGADVVLRAIESLS